MEQSNIPTIPNNTQVDSTLPSTDALHARATADGQPDDNSRPSIVEFHARAKSSGVDSLIHDSNLTSPLPSEGGLDSFPIADESLPASPLVSFDSDSYMPPIIDFSTAGLRRSGRITKQPNRLTFGSFFTHNDLCLWHGNNEHSTMDTNHQY